MGKNMERLERLQANRGAFGTMVALNVQTDQRNAASEAVDTVTSSVQKAARADGFEGPYGDVVTAGLTDLRDRLNEFADYQAKLNAAIELANKALDDTANNMSGLPAPGLTPAQQNTIDIASSTGSPVQPQPGVTMPPSEAKQYYLDQAAAAQEEQAAKMTAALDVRLQEIIDGMPTPQYHH